MSLDAKYILIYDLHALPSACLSDAEWLYNTFGGQYVIFDNHHCLFWDKPKYKLLPDDISKLECSQLFECDDNSECYYEIDLETGLRADGSDG